MCTRGIGPVAATVRSAHAPSAPRAAAGADAGCAGAGRRGIPALDARGSVTHSGSGRLGTSSSAPSSVPASRSVPVAALYPTGCAGNSRARTRAGVIGQDRCQRPRSRAHNAVSGHGRVGRQPTMRGRERHSLDGVEVGKVLVKVVLGRLAKDHRAGRGPAKTGVG